MRPSVGKIGIDFLAGIFQVPPDIVAANLPMLAPLPTSPADLAHRKRVDEILSEDTEVWEERAGYLLFAEADATLVNDKMKLLLELRPDLEGTAVFDNTLHQNPATYGEVTTTGCRQIFYNMGMTGAYAASASSGDDAADNPEEAVSNAIHFIDMGSGVGKFAMQAYLELPRIASSKGVELAPARHENAVAAWKELQELAREIRHSIPDHSSLEDGVPDAKVEFIQGDLLEVDISEITHMYISSLCFTDDMMYQLGKRFERGDAPKLECMASIRQFPLLFERKGILDRISYKSVQKTFGFICREELVDMSWTDRGPGCTVYFYSKPPYTF